MVSISTSLTSLQNNLTTFPSSFFQPKLRHCSFSSNSIKLRHLKASNTTNYNEDVIDEEMSKIKLLQDGPDVRGVALEGEKGRAVNFTPAAVEAIAEGFGEWVIDGFKNERQEAADVKNSLGRDPRLSGSLLSVAAFSGLACAGCVAFDMGLATTPACFMSTVLPGLAYDASMMGGLSSPEVEEICEKAAQKYANRLAKVSSLLKILPTRVDFMGVYADHLCEIIKEKVNHPLHYDTPLEGFKVFIRFHQA